MDLFGAGTPDHPHDLPAGRPTHDRVVDDDHPPAFQHLAHRVELHLDPEVTDALLGLDECPANIVIADEAHLVAGSGLLRVTQRRARSRVGNRDDDVGTDRMLAGELAAQRLAHGVDVAAPQHGVGAREVHVLEHAVLALGRREGADRFRNLLSRPAARNCLLQDDAHLGGERAAVLSGAIFQRLVNVVGKVLHE